MFGQYDLWFTDDAGTRLRPLNDFLRLQCSRAVNRLGGVELRVPATFPESLLARDRMIQVWRAPAAGRLGLWRVYFLRRWRFERDAQGNDVLILWGPDQNDLLRRRIVAHYAGSSNADFDNEYADDLMKTLVTDSIADGTNPAPEAGTRVWSSLNVAVDASAGPQINKGVSWDPLLTRAGGGALAEVALAAWEAGTEVFFDVVPDAVSPTAISFLFQTYIGQPGQDVSSRIVFDAEAGTLGEPYYEFNAEEEATYIYAAGQGDEDRREVQQAYDAARYNASQWNRCEGFADARDQAVGGGGVADRAASRLAQGQPVELFGGKLKDSQGRRFGRDWDVGYRVKAKYRGQTRTGIVWAVVLTVEGGHETVDARMDVVT